MKRKWSIVSSRISGKMVPIAKFIGAGDAYIYAKSLSSRLESCGEAHKIVCQAPNSTFVFEK